MGRGGKIAAPQPVNLPSMKTENKEYTTLSSVSGNKSWFKKEEPEGI